MKRLLSALAVAVATVGASIIGAAAPASALVEHCTMTLLSDPVIVRAGLGNTGTDAGAVVCVGTAGPAGGMVYQGFGVGVHPFGPGSPGFCGTASYTAVGTEWQNAPGTVGAGGSTWTGTWPSVCSHPDGTYSVHVPVTFCVGAACVASPVSGVGKTGVIVGTFTPHTTGPGGTTGAGYSLYGNWLMVDGQWISIGPSHYNAVGVVAPDPSDFSVPPGEPVVCGPLNLVCVPGSAGIGYAGGDVLGVAVAGLGTSYYQGVPLGGGCYPLFTTPGSNPC